MPDHELGVFGWELVLDITDCDLAVISSHDKLSEFAVRACEVLQMKRYGEPLIERFGFAKPETTGYTLVQLIETSSLVAHFSEAKRTAYIEIFSCKEFSPQAVIDFCREFFGSAHSRFIFLERV